MADTKPLQPSDASDAAGAGRSGPRLAYRGAAWAFGVALLLSLAALAVSLAVTLSSGGRLPLAAEDEAPSLVLVLSTATTVVSLIGLLSTNLLAWRREARESRETEVELQRQRLEIEKLKLELEKQRRNT
jgi:hypothetical protein